MPTPPKLTVLVINSGSSSVKFTLFGNEDEAVLSRGVVERIGLDGTRIATTSHDRKKMTRPVAVGDALEAVACIVDCLVDKEHGVLKSRRDVAAVGHRVVHGGEKIIASEVVDDQVKKIIKENVT